MHYHTAGSARKRGDDGPAGAWERDDLREAVEPAFRRLYAAYEWLRDGASPFDVMTACRLQSPNWWRTARDALAAAQSLLDDLPVVDSGSQASTVLDDQAWLVAMAVRWAFEAAVALRLPYVALQPAESWALGWRGLCSQQVTTSGDDATIAACRAVLTAAGARCQGEGIAPDLYAAALDHAGRVGAVCYTERQKSSWT